MEINLGSPQALRPNGEPAAPDDEFEVVTQVQVSGLTPDAAVELFIATQLFDDSENEGIRSGDAEVINELLSATEREQLASARTTGALTVSFYLSSYRDAFQPDQRDLRAFDVFAGIIESEGGDPAIAKQAQAEAVARWHEAHAAYCRWEAGRLHNYWEDDARAHEDMASKYRALAASCNPNLASIRRRSSDIGTRASKPQPV